MITHPGLLVSPQIGCFWGFGVEKLYNSLGFLPTKKPLSRPY